MMIKVFSFIGVFLFLASGFAQTVGVVECNGRTSISSWDAPDSIIVVDQLSCGQKLPVLGIEKGYVKVLVRQRVSAYVEAEYIRFIDEEIAPVPSVAELVKQDASFERDVPAPAAPSLSSQLVSVSPKTSLDPSPREVLLKPGLELGLDASYIKYEEPGVMKQEGATLSLYGTYTFRPKNWMLRLDGRAGFAGMSYSSPVSGTADGIRDYIVEARFLVGPSFKASNEWYLTPYSGLGYRYLFDGFQGVITSEGHMGYDRKSNYLYSPIGLESANSLTYGWSLVTALEYDLFWHGWQVSELGPVYDTDFTARNEQESGWGMRASGKFIKEAGKYKFAFGPYMKYWNIDDSDLDYFWYEGEEYSVMEPANNSIEIGGMFGVHF